MKPFKVLGSIAMVVALLAMGFSVFMYRVTEKSALEQTMPNLSQLPSGNIGFLYLENWKTDELDLLTIRISELLQSSRIDHLFITGSIQHQNLALDLKRSLSHYENRLSIDLEVSSSVLASMVDVCRSNNNCLVTVLGPKATVTKGLFAANLIGREAVGYAISSIELDSNPYREVIARMQLYIESQSLNPAGTARHLLLTQQANQER